MNRREIVGNLLGWMLIGVVLYGAYEATTTPVTVPLILPVVSLLGGVTGLACVVHWWRFQGAIERQKAERRALPETTVADVLGGYRTGPRIGDDERDIIIRALHMHYGAGRLDDAELGDRLALAMSAKTLDDLETAVSELPSEVDGR